eukprot:72246-Amorphochlora_amoeboformis.AAC.1
MRLRPKHSILNDEALTRFKTQYVKKTVRRKSTLDQPAAKRRKHIRSELEVVQGACLDIC